MTRDTDTHLVVIGNGMAGHRLVTTLLAREDRPARITVLGEEASHAYNRILLSPWLAGELGRDELALPAMAAEGVECRPGARVIDIDRSSHTLTLESGERLHYDRLVIATGARPTLPEVAGIQLGNVGAFRTVEDGEWLRQQPPGSNAVVIGGGLLGLEAAEGLRKLGVHVSVLQRSDRLMNRQLDAVAAGWLKQTLTRRGITINTGAELARLDGDSNGSVRSLTLRDGRTLAADCVVVAAGITPNATLGQLAGLEVGRGICVDEHLATRDPAIFALGECAEVDGATIGLVEPIWQQVETLVDVLCHRTPAPYQALPSPTRLKVAGIDLYAFGPVEPSEGMETLTYADPEHGDYRRLLIDNDRIKGAVLYGDTRDGPELFRLATTDTALGKARALLIFGAHDAIQQLEEAA